MTARSVWVYVALVVGAFGLVAGLGALERNPQVLEGPRKVAWGWLLGVEPEPEPVYSVTVSIDRDGVVRRNGTEVDRLAKTQVTDGGFSVSGTLSMLNQDRGATGGTPTNRIRVSAAGSAWGGPSCVIQDVTGLDWEGSFDYPDPAPDPPEGTRYVIAVMILMPYLDISQEIVEHEFVYFMEDDEENWEIVRSYNITVDADRRIERNETLTESGERDAAPAYAADRDVVDEWVLGDDPPSWSVTFGGLSSSGTAVWLEEPPMWDPHIGPITIVGGRVDQHHVEAGVKYAEITVNWAGADYNLSRYWKDLGAWRLEGTGNGVEAHGTTDTYSVDNGGGFAVGEPRSWDFGKRYASVDRDGNPHSDYCLSGPWQASNHCPASLTWATTPDGLTFGAEPGDAVYPTVDDLYGVGQYTDPINIGGLDLRDPSEDEPLFFTSAKMQVSLTEASVQRADLVEAYGHYDGDLEVMMRVPPLSATSCDAEPDVSGIATLTFNEGLGIYGPEDGGERALDHDDWAPGENTTRPNLSGGFEVSGGKGSLTLQMPNNFGSRLLAVPQQNFPDGMPGWPVQYLFHKAGIYRIYDGRTCPKGGTHSEPLEARYCWRGVPCVDVGLSVASSPTDPIMATVKCRTWSITDTHVTDSTRQEDAEATPTYHEWTYVVRHVNEANYIYLGTPEEGGGEPDLEDVYEITLSNIPGGEHTIDEPTFARDPLSSEDMTLKIFESPRDDYRHGGYSAVVDHVCRYALMDSHEGNGGHDTKIEPTVRMWDHLHSPPTSEVYTDLTSAWDRQQIASILHNVGDAFSCTYSDATFEEHYKDEDDAYLTGGYAFDFCHPLDATKPLEQPVGDINFACRARSWRSVPGLLYTAWWDHVGGGKMHSYMVDDDHALLRNLPDAEDPESPFPSVDRKPAGGTGQSWWSGETDSAGYWVTDSGEVYNAYDPAVLWQYMAGSTTSRFATREYAYATLAAESAPGVPWLHWMTGGWLHIAVAQDGVVRYYWTHPFSSAPTLQDTGAHPFGETGGFSNPFITSYSCGWLLAGATDANGMRLSLSRDFGGSWEEIEGTTLVGDLRDGCVAIQDGVLAACGWKDNTIVFRSASGTSYAAESLYIGGPTQATICAAAEDTRSQVLWVNGVLEVLVEGVGYYRTRDWGTSWTQVPAPHIADGMTGGTCAFVDGEVLASGIEAGEVRVESAYRDDRTPEAFYIGGPTHIAVVEASVRNAVEAVHGERWVATGEDGLTLYRTRNPADGFAKII